MSVEMTRELAEWIAERLLAEFYVGSDFNAYDNLIEASDVEIVDFLLRQWKTNPPWPHSPGEGGGC